MLTGPDGQLAGVLPKHALVMVKQGVIFSEHGYPQGVDPRPSQKAFAWLIGRGAGQGLDPAAQNQLQAQRIVEQLVRACVVADQPGRELIARLYAELVRVAPQWKLPEPLAEPAPEAEVPAEPAPVEPPADVDADSEGGTD